MTTEHECCRVDPECPGCVAEDQSRSLTSAIRAIAHGGIAGPTGLEALTMSISGPGNFDRNLCTAIGESGDAIAAALDRVADALNAIAAAVTPPGEAS